MRAARFARACWWLALGVALVPLKPRSKHLQPGFGPHQTTLTQHHHARRWFLNTAANLAVVLGGARGLSVADWDDAAAYLQWRATRGAEVHTLTEQSARGYHLFFWAPDLPSAAARGCELKTTGACAVAPSRHPSGAYYRVLYPAPIATLDPSTAHALFPFLSAGPYPKPPSNPVSPSQPQTGLVARIKAARPILHELRDAGIRLRPAGPHTLVGRCPFHDDHAPSLWVYPHTDLWGCNRPDCLAAGTHDVINFRARWLAISNQAALRQLALEYL